MAMFFHVTSRITGAFIRSTISKFPVFGLHTTAAVRGEPLKKKKRVDPTIEQNRVRRKTKRIEKEIKRFTRQERQLKPIAEIEGDRRMLKEIEQHKRPPIDISENECDRRVTLLKDWTRYQNHVADREQHLFSRVLKAQSRALEWLYITSPELYRAAIQPCLTVLPEGEAAAAQTTLPIEDLAGPWYSAPRVHGDLVDCPESEYDPPDGECHDSTPVFHYDFELENQFLAEPRKKKK